LDDPACELTPSTRLRRNALCGLHDDGTLAAFSKERRHIPMATKTKSKKTAAKSGKKTASKKTASKRGGRKFGDTGPRQ
jgi:hypothetical protein